MGAGLCPREAAGERPGARGVGGSGGGDCILGGVGVGVGGMKVRWNELDKDRSSGYAIGSE